MDLLQLRYFFDVAETQHMTKSAERLHISQPALTKTIHNLEADLGVPLFTRSGRNIVLSSYGIYLKNRLGPILSELDALPEKLQKMAEVLNETINLNVLAASSLIADAVIAYKADHPDIKFELLQNTAESNYDIQISTKLLYQVRPEECADTFVCGEKIFLAVPNIPRFANMKSVSLKHMAQEKFISLSDARQFRLICDKLCQHVGFSPKIVFESDSPTAVKNIIASNMGVGFWPEFTWGEISGDQILLLEIEDELFSRDIIISMKRSKKDNKYVEDFFERIKSICLERKRAK